MGESDFVSYRVHTNQYCQVGGNVSFKGQMWVVTESVITYESGLIYYEYVLMQRAALRRKVRTNRALQGVALEGRVIKRGNNMVKVHLDIDHDHDERGNWWFPYSPEGNNIFHCMPEKGACIKVYFPEGTEKKAIAINSVRGRNDEMKSRTVFQKPMTKVFHMPGAAKMELGEDGVLFEKNTVSLTLDGNDISLNATESILVVASNEIELGGQNMPEHIKLVANETITFFTNTDHYMEIRPEYVGIKGKKVSLEKVEMDFLDMLTDEELEKLYVDHELEVANKERKENRRYISGFSAPAYHWTEEVRQKITNDAIARVQNPKTKESAKESLKALGEDELQRRYKEKFIPPPPKPENKSKKERAQEQQEYAEFYQGYIDIRSGKKAPPKQPTSPWKAVKDHIERQANHNEALQGLVNASKALSGSIEKWGDRWEERREEHQLNELIPQVPDYFSKIPDEEIYFSRFTFEELVVKQQKLMTELNLMFGVVAFVGAFFTAGGSLYLLAAANGVWGVAQMGVGFMKLQDLNDGVVSDTSLLGINQEMLDVTGVILGAVDLAIFGKSLLKGAKRAYNARYVKGIDQVSTPKTRVDGNELRTRVIANVKASAAARGSSKFDEYLKIEKELLEALEKKKTSSRGPFEGTGKGAPKSKIPNVQEMEKALVEATSNRAREIFESGVSKKEMGPCLSGIYDPLTGETYFGQNFKNNATMRLEYQKWLDNDADQIIKDLVKEYEFKIKNGEIKLSEVADNRLAAHSELRALDQVLKARRKSGLPVDRSTISELFLHNIDLYKLDGNGNLVTKIRCEHCRYLTDGINTVGHN